METLTINTAESLLVEITAIFAEITRYPEEILDPNAHLEDDLGIDSVKLGEIYSVLRERYKLPEDMEIAPEKLQTIQLIYEALTPYINKSGTISEKKSADILSMNAHENDIKSQKEEQLDRQIIADEVLLDKTDDNLENKIINIFAEVTRYPKEILDPHAHLEDDLGIDSVKLGEIYSILKERFDLKEEQQVAPEQLQSINGIVTAIQSFIGTPVSKISTSNSPEKVIKNTTSISENTAKKPAVNGKKKPTYSDFFIGKKVFISGSGRSLGKDIAIYLAELGATVVINSFHSRDLGDQTCKEINDKGQKALHLWGSMANPKHVDRIWDDVEKELGSIDFYVSAASNGMLDKLENITPEHWDRAFRTNVVGLHQSALRAVKLMRKNGGGKIITMSSPAAHGYVDYFGVMGAAKAAVESLTRSMAVEFEEHNVQVNCVSPGPVYGELLKKWPESKELVGKWEENTAYHRLCVARDVSKFIAYLLSDEAQLFNGSVLVQDGGISSRNGKTSNLLMP